MRGAELTADALPGGWFSMRLPRGLFLLFLFVLIPRLMALPAEAYRVEQ